jgi:hypothetical protein
MLLSVFAGFVFISMIFLKGGLVFFSFIIMLIAFYMLDWAYGYLRDSLEERLKASK